MRYQISYNAPSKAILGVIGAGPGKAWVDVDAGAINAKLGWASTVTIPRASIVSVARVERVPRWLGFGMHGTGFGTWALNGSHNGVVKLTFSEPASGKVLRFPIRPKAIYVSLEDPDGFIADVSPLTAA
jgi:hypothetical protein